MVPLEVANWKREPDWHVPLTGLVMVNEPGGATVVVVVGVVVVGPAVVVVLVGAVVVGPVVVVVGVVVVVTVVQE